MGKQQFTLFRRHIKSCTNTTPITDTTLGSLTLRINKIDCSCPIVATGYLKFEKARLQKLPMNATDWTVAQTTANKLLVAGRLPKIQNDLTPDSVTVEFAVNRYLTGRTAGGNPVAKQTLTIFEGVLKGLLIPFCQEHGVVNITDFEARESSARFVESWTNTRTGEPLKIGTKRLHMQVFRAFLAFCLDNDWIKKNTAKLIVMKKRADEDDVERHGFELVEYEQVMRALDTYPDTLHTRRLRSIVELMRWCGLRISDAVKFNHTEVKRNLAGDGFNAEYVQKKNGRLCVSPIPPHVYEMLQALPHDGVCDGKRYWFKNCVSEHPIKPWEFEIGKLFTLAAKEGKFAYHMSPHSLRHTFAIQHLNNEVDVKYIANWLGHKSIKTTEKYYSRWIKSTKIESESQAQKSYLELMKKTAALTAAPGKVVAIS